MRDNLLIFLFLSLLSISAYSQNGWFWQHPYPIGHHLISVFNVSNNVFYTCGYDGAILKSTNSGLNWELKSTGTLDHFSCSYFFNDDTGYVFSNRIFKTTDGGNSWRNQFGEFNQINSCSFYNENIGFVVGDNGIIYKTSNGGNNWLPSNNTGINPTFIKIDCIDKNTFVVASSSNLILRTTNQGNNWEIQALDSNEKIATVDILDSNFGFMFSYIHQKIGRIEHRWKTTNGGLSWLLVYNDITGVPIEQKLRSHLNSKVTVNDLKKITFTDINTGYSVGFNGTVLKTIDRGVNWQNLNFPNSVYLMGLCFTNNSTGFVSGSGNNIYKTSNGGSSWQNKLTVLSSVYSIYFLDQSVGFLCGYPAIISKTTNGGDNWVTKFSGGNSGLVDIEFSSINTGYAVSAIGTILKTTNSGENWMQVAQGFDYLWSVDFISDDTGFFSTGNGKILRTNNGGMNWTQKNTNVTNQLNSVDFLNSNTGYAVGQRIVKTTNGGENWNTIFQFSNGANFLWSIQFRDTNIGYVVGDHGTILMTTNGGGSIVGIGPKKNDNHNNYTLSQNYPNPFNPTTKIKFQIISRSNVRIIVFDVLGRIVETLVDDVLQPGFFEYLWNGAEQPGGIYFYRIESNNFVETKKMILLK